MSYGLLGRINCQRKARTCLVSKASLQVFSTYLPFSGQSKKLASNAIAKIIEKRSLLAHMKRDRKKFDVKLDRALQTGSANDIAAAQLDLEKAEERIAKLQSTIQHQENRLGLTGQTKLKEFKESEFLRLRLNATVLRQRIVTRLVAHRFEMSKFDRLARYERMGRYIGYLFHYL